MSGDMSPGHPYCRSRSTLACVTCFVDNFIEERDGDVLHEGIRALSEALAEMEV
jgi:hypothetical protein